MKIFIVESEHFHVPGVHIEAYKSELNATRAAVAMANALIESHNKTHGGCITLAISETWQDRVEELEEYHGAAYVRVEITELETGD